VKVVRLTTMRVCKGKGQKVKGKKEAKDKNVA
jgi:hypothetical protein